MLAFRVDDMSCAHCVSTITKAVHGVDSGAEVRIDLGSHRVEIESTRADAATFAAVIEEAGYTPVALEHRDAVAPQGPARRGSCCG